MGDGGCAKRWWAKLPSVARRGGRRRLRVTLLAVVGVLAVAAIGLTAVSGREPPAPSQPPAGDEGLADERIMSLVPAEDDTLWAATSAGVSVFHGDGWRTYTTEHGLPDDSAFSVVVTDDGTVWAATSGGVSVLDG